MKQFIRVITRISLRSFLLVVLLVGALAVSGAPAVRAATYSLTDLGTFGGGYTIPRDINETGKVAGYAYTAGGDVRAFLWDGGPIQISAH